MGFSSIWHWVIVLLIVLILFGRGRIAEMMGDFGKGISSFKKGLNETEDTAAKAVRIEPPAAAPAPTEAPAPAPADKTDTTGA
ncbi:sec-independent protein translocase protein TatA [Erythromicrobium ramosum]|jgi:sec-independent protein translocase protein TatA|uniref:Sec-independent protein translocase protein TatA n=1 Tax=Erythrobacter ramosus TaxID=35811 RepID=A0A6I4UPV3_9SPHN|nr:twin-arginine translocase TatA/TatE family subunit [Erythrobacter ramosus]MBB3776785.1 sec-independent protein translocase protein TatA [Erythrobacter ramosus]MXP39639.1 twin-arginine translocase TatA/TatE family subunit [Erythrobacter ramosus]